MKLQHAIQDAIVMARQLNVDIVVVVMEGSDTGFDEYGYQRSSDSLLPNDKVVVTISGSI